MPRTKKEILDSAENHVHVSDHLLLEVLIDIRDELIEMNKPVNVEVKNREAPEEWKECGAPGCPCHERLNRKK